MGRNELYPWIIFGKSIRKFVAAAVYEVLAVLTSVEDVIITRVQASTQTAGDLSI